MEEDSCFLGGNDMDLLSQFEDILEGDKLIDEIGFLHPSQFSLLDEVPSDSPPTLNTPIHLSETNTANRVQLQYGKTIFWNKNHKLGICTNVLSHLYIAARHAYMDVSRRYKASINVSSNRGAVCSAAPRADFDHLLENEILKHTKALLILSCNFGSAWNLRRLVLLRRHEISFFLDELRFSALVFSYAPKCEYAWSQRRWVIKMLEKKLQSLDEHISEESALVEKIAEKSKMNYRAWSHRCWLISFMKRAQVLHELDKLKQWAELHVADNCCFHYRRELLLKILEDNYSQCVEASTDSKFDICCLWKEELKWTELLIRRYIGREALWIHRRFLAQCWITHFTTNEGAIMLDPEDPLSSSTEIFLAKELQLLKCCFDILADGFDDTQDQAQYAACYFLWIFKFVLPQEPKHEQIIKEVREMKPILQKACPWNNLCCKNLFK
ncbi:protein prenyltransferase alpha subunit repeat-containing protein 1 isoform X1 [Canna indica]|uniref:Protein prenyltransferase alpha subunit repeat-containing protein 1 isoform X1 n=1 Tax=Canna indica TaxID=4628 RepID=A0AAQ3KTH1_9LILI|nr:protein prenyltransferase alpha subunit repeat-containing protein 1 isoform X1 [Canna indica]